MSTEEKLEGLLEERAQLLEEVRLLQDEVARYRQWLRAFYHEIDEMQDRIRKEVL